jgi:DNA-binding transcriptional MerR regulator
MTIKNENELVFNEDENRLTIHFSPEISEGYRKYDKSDYIFADILSWLKSFNLEIKAIRKKYNITPTDYPKKPTVESLIELLFQKIGYEKYRKLDRDIIKLQNDYCLTDNWILSLRIAVITNALLVPASETIHIHYPSYETKQKTSLKRLPNILYSPEVRKLDNVMRLAKYPSIYFSRKTSPEELKKWVDKNKKLIRAIQNKLPSKKRVKRDTKTLFWGKIVWIFKQDGIRPLAEISRRIQSEAERIIDEQGEEGNEELCCPPTAVELRKYYERFLESLQKAETSNK